MSTSVSSPSLGSDGIYTLRLQPRPEGAVSAAYCDRQRVAIAEAARILLAARRLDLDRTLTLRDSAGICKGCGLGLADFTALAEAILGAVPPRQLIASCWLAATPR